MQISARQSGFTLLELLLYVSISGILMVGIVSFMIVLQTARVKQTTIGEVEQQGSQAMAYMTQVLRNAQAVTAPTPGTNSNSITIDVVDSTSDPTVFTESSGVLQVSEGTTPIVTDLTSDTVVVSDLLFENNAISGTRDTITISITLTHANPTGKPEYRYDQTFTDTVQLLPN